MAYARPPLGLNTPTLILPQNKSDFCFFIRFEISYSEVEVYIEATASPPNIPKFALNFSSSERYISNYSTIRFISRIARLNCPPEFVPQTLSQSLTPPDQDNSVERRADKREESASNVTQL